MLSSSKLSEAQLRPGQSRQTAILSRYVSPTSLSIASFQRWLILQGGHIMLAGIVFQMGKLTTVGSYPYRSYDIFSRNHHLCYTRLGVHPPLLVEQSHTHAGNRRRIPISASGQTKLMLLGLTFTSVTIFIR